MTSKPLISVIVAVYNGSKTLQRCIDSISNQTYSNKELIVIDGGSTDGTIDILIANDDKITYWKSESDDGIYNAWNKALEHVSGDWIYFLGSDDYLWESSVFEKLIPHMIEAESQNMRMMYGQVAMVTKKNEISYIEGVPWEYIWRNIIVDGICTFAHQGMFHHHSLFEIYGTFDESFKIIGDYELIVRAFKKGGDALFVDGVIVAGMQTGGISGSYIKSVKEIVKARRNNGLRGITIPWLISYAWFLCYPFFKYIIGDKNIRHLVNFGKCLIRCLPYKIT